MSRWAVSFLTITSIQSTHDSNPRIQILSQWLLPSTLRINLYEAASASHLCPALRFLHRRDFITPCRRHSAWRWPPGHRLRRSRSRCSRSLRQARQIIHITTNTSNNNTNQHESLPLHQDIRVDRDRGTRLFDFHIVVDANTLRRSCNNSVRQPRPNPAWLNLTKKTKPKK